MNATNTQDVSSPSPKLGRENTFFFRYYAGFSEHFVEATIRRHSLPGAAVLDPWNGAGTTTAVAARLGLLSTGVDVNPCMNHIALSRIQSTQVWEDVARCVPSSWKPTDSRIEVLSRWFTPKTAAMIRGIERKLWRELGGVPAAYPYDSFRLGAPLVSERASAAAVALAIAVRSHLGKYQTSNPTWIRLRVPTHDRISLDETKLLAAFRSVVSEIVTSCRASKSLEHSRMPQLLTADSNLLPLEEQSFDLVVTSPPYCTRMDYVVATLPELALLGIPSWGDVQALRTCMIGSPSHNPDSILDREQALPDSIAVFLSRIAKHESKASNGYYRRYFSAYFERLATSLREIARVLRLSGVLVMVVQDSHYKEVRVQLGEFVSDLAECYGLTVMREERFEVPNGMALNPAGRRYRSSNATTEYVITMKKEVKTYARATESADD